MLKPGGRLAIADIVLRRGLSEPTRALIGLWTGCVAGALVVEDYEAKLRAAGFGDISIEPTRVFEEDGVVGLAAELSVDADLPEGTDRDEVMAEVAGSVMSAFVRGPEARVGGASSGSAPDSATLCARRYLTPPVGFGSGCGSPRRWLARYCQLNSELRLSHGH